MKIYLRKAYCPRLEVIVAVIMKISFLEYGAVGNALLSIYVREKIDEVVFRLFHGQDGESKLLRNFDT